MTIGPAERDESCKVIGVMFYDSFKSHYTLAYTKDGQWLHYDGQLKPCHTQHLTTEIIQR